MERTDATPPGDDAMLQPGSTLEGRYRIVEELGAGGMGIVFRAEHLRLGRAVAIKVLREELVANERLRPRFEREARALAALSHPHIVTVTDYGLFHGRPYLVMELCEGRTLDILLLEQRLETPRALGIVRQVLEGLAVAHAQGLAHRDLKPGNILLQALPTGRDHVKILDFGFAKFVEGQEATAQSADLTRSGIGFGTPAYMSPEQATGSASDVRADVYSMGVLMFEMLTGRHPFQGDIPELVRQHLSSPPPTLAEVCPHAAFAPELEAIVAQAMEKDPGARHRDAGAMLAAVEALDAPVAGPSPRRSAGDGRTGGPPSSTESTSPHVRAQPHPEQAVESPRRRLGWLGCVLPAVVLGAGAAGLHALGIEVPLGGDWDSARGGATAPSAAGEGDESAAPPRAPSPAAAGEAEGLSAPLGPGAAGTAVDASASDAHMVADAAGGAHLELADAGRSVVPDAATMRPAAAGPSVPDGGQRPEADDGGGQARPPAVNPWRRSAAPRVLTRARRQLYRGQGAGDALVRTLRREARTRRGARDPRPHLLLAEAYVQRGWLSDAIRRYEIVARLDPQARGDPRMLRNLLRLVANEPAVANRAASAVERIYGSEAIEAIGHATKAPSVDAAGERRLHALRERLRR